MLRIDLGGGKNPRPGFTTVDRSPGADHVINFDLLYPVGMLRLPFATDSVDEAYSSHTAEHLEDISGFLWETVRVCKVGAPFTLIVPHWLQSMAMCSGHKHTIAPEQVRHWCELYVTDWWQGSAKRLRLDGIDYVAGEAFGELRGLLPAWTDDQIRRLLPNATHEIVYHLVVIPND